MASLVDAIRKILDKYNTLGQYRILFGTCSCKVVDRKERKKLMIKHRKKTMLWSNGASREKVFSEKKQFRDMKKKTGNTEKTAQKYKTMDTG